MVTLFITASELKKVKTLLERGYQIIFEVNSKNFSCLCIEVEVLPFQLSEEEIMQNLQALICESGEFRKIDLGNRRKACVIGSPLRASEAIYIGWR